MVEDFVYFSSIINSNGDCCQEITKRLGRTAEKKLEKIIKGKDMAQETKAKIINSIVL